MVKGASGLITRGSRLFAFGFWLRFVAEAFCMGATNEQTNHVALVDAVRRRELLKHRKFYRRHAHRDYLRSFLGDHLQPV